MLLREFFTSKKLKISLWKIRTEEICLYQTLAMLVFKLKSKDCFPFPAPSGSTDPVTGEKEVAEELQSSLKGTEAAS